MWKALKQKKQRENLSNYLPLSASGQGPIIGLTSFAGNEKVQVDGGHSGGGRRWLKVEGPRCGAPRV
ncbi:hypothetical protein V6Z11_A03G119100 [Gossypium hirsutum]